MNSYQLIICCVVSLLTIRKDFNQFFLVCYCLYYVITDYLLSYEFLFYNQQYLILLDISVLILCLRLITNQSAYINYSKDVNLLTTIGLMIISSSLVIYTQPYYIVEILNNKNWLLYFITNWHYELLIILLININLKDSVNHDPKINIYSPVRICLGLTTILYLTIINYF